MYPVNDMVTCLSIHCFFAVKIIVDKKIDIAIMLTNIPFLEIYNALASHTKGWYEKKHTAIIDKKIRMFFIIMALYRYLIAAIVTMVGMANEQTIAARCAKYFLLYPALS